MSATETTETPLLDELAARDEQVVAARVRIREVETQAQAARAEAGRITEELTEAFASGDDSQAAKLTRAKDKADAKAAEPWPERVAGAQRAAQRVQAERDGWIVANISGLLAEIAPGAHAATEAITTKARELDEARREWHASEQRVMALLRPVPGVDGRSLPGIEHVDTAIKDVLRATAEMPPPLPPAHAEQNRGFGPHGEIEAGVVRGELANRLTPEDKERFAQRVVQGST